MKIKKNISLLILIFIVLACNPNNEFQDNTSEIIKVAFRSAGNELLLLNNDSTSLVLPITKLGRNKYQLTFQNNLSISPDSLVSTISKNLELANLSKDYIIEVLNCESEEVAYSFQIKNTIGSNIIPCRGRDLPSNCYTIDLIFLENTSFLASKKKYLLIILIIISIVIGLFYKNMRRKPIKLITSNYTKIGNYKFYQNQNKIVKDAVEIKLSVKECELMNLFSEQQNQVIKRDVITKEIWEDNGVFVGRSLDTFISKLRKKFKDDTSINIINVHGVGYKLEVK